MAIALRREDSVLTSLRELRHIEDGRREQERADAAARAAALREDDARRLAAREAAEQHARAEAEAAAARDAVARQQAERDERLRMHEAEARVRAEAEAVAQRAAFEAVARQRVVDLAVAPTTAPARRGGVLAAAFAVIALACGTAALQRHLALGAAEAELGRQVAATQAATDEQRRTVTRLEQDVATLRAELAATKAAGVTAPVVAPVIAPPTSSKPGTKPGSKPGSKPGDNKPNDGHGIVIRPECIDSPLC